uniref:Uncharacterized protein n=1 Tax=Anopheles coluzzii TaxID=1518534 RepID=A0A8W7PWU1_ANOCL
MPSAASSGRRGNGTAAPAHQQRKGKGGGGGSGGTVVKGEGSGAARAPQDPDEDTNAGFGKYLRSQEGNSFFKTPPQPASVRAVGGPVGCFDGGESNAALNVT